MNSPATRVRGVTYVYGYGTPQQTLVTKTSVPFQRRRVDDVKDISRVVKQIGDDVELATLGSRSIPFGGPIVVIASLALTNGQPITVNHLLGIDRIEWSLWDPTGVTAGSPVAYRTAVDATTLTLHALGTFSADLVMGLKP